MTSTNDKIWYYAEDGQQVGPFSGDEIRKMIESAKLSATTSIWTEGMTEWLPISKVAVFAPPRRSPLAPLAPPKIDEEEEHHLKLGGARKYDKVNTKDDDPTAGVSVQDFLVDKQGKPTEPPIIKNSKVGFFESFGLGSFESAFFAITLILGGIGCLVVQEYWHVIVIGLGALWIIAASFALVVRAFIKHWAWGLVYLFIPFGQLIYIIVDFKNAGKSLILMVVGIAAIITPIKTESFKESPIYDSYVEIRDEVQAQIDQQKQQMEEQRQEKLDQFEE